MSITRGDIRERIARRFGRFRNITCTGGSTTTAISTSGLFEPDDYWNGALLYVRNADGAAPEEETRVVTDYDQSSQTLTVELAYTATLASGDVVELYAAAVPPDELTEMIENAVRVADGLWFRTVRSTIGIETLSALASTSGNKYVIDVPAECTRMRGVYVRASSSTRFHPFPYWRMISQTGRPDRNMMLTARLADSAEVMFEYEARLAFDPGTADTDPLNIVYNAGEQKYEGHCVAWIVEYCLEQLYLRMANEGDDAHRNFYWNLGRLAREERHRIARENSMAHIPGQVQQIGWAEHGDDMRDRAYSQLAGGGTEPGT